MSEVSRWECEYNLVSGENERLKTKISTLESALAFTEQTRDVDADIRKIRELNVELLEKNKSLKD